VNLGNIKNVVGCFANPILVLIDTQFLKTLSKREFNSGMAEVIKHSIICNESYASIIEGFKNQKVSMVEVIFESLKIKKHIVELDFKEKAERKLLNFGHTIGHAFESIAMQINKSLLHGEAVIIGMIIESQIAFKLGVINESNWNKIKSFIASMNLFCLNKEEKEYYNTSSLIDYIKKDKKNEHDNVKMVLPIKFGECVYDQSVKIEFIEQVLNEFLNEKD